MTWITLGETFTTSAFGCPARMSFCRMVRSAICADERLAEVPTTIA